MILRFYRYLTEFLYREDLENIPGSLTPLSALRIKLVSFSYLLLLLLLKENNLQLK